jgi:hypothetical protein
VGHAALKKETEATLPPIKAKISCDAARMSSKYQIWIWGIWLT